MRIAIVLGTRPEAIKLVAVSAELASRGHDVRIISSGQHRELLNPLLESFGMLANVELDVMRPNQTLHELTGSLVAKLGEAVPPGSYDAVVVQGDTTTAMAGAMAGFYAKSKVCHVEAGLRTYDRYSPFPEEVNRRLVSCMATRHYAPTGKARDNLLAEGISASDILVTGNTVIDALRWVVENKQAVMEASPRALGLAGKPYVLMTTHRRENIGEKMREVFRAIRDYLRVNPSVHLVLPLHRNPKVREVVLEMLEEQPNAMLIEAQQYLEFCGLMKGAQFIVTDSGGIQEEAPFFNKRTLVIRDTTERPEAMEAGTAYLVGTQYDKVRQALDSAHAEAVDGKVPDLRNRNPFGDGHAAQRIAADMELS